MSQDSPHASSKALTSEQIDALWTIDAHVDGEIKLKNALMCYPESAAELHTQIARCLGLQGRFDEAWEEIAKVSNEVSGIVSARIELECGRLKNSSGDKTAAHSHFLSALSLAEQAHADFYAVDAAHMLGIVSEGQEPVRWNEMALHIAMNSADARARSWQGSLLNNLGWSHFNAGALETALTSFESALDFQRTTGDAARIRVALWTVARCLRALKRYDEALVIQNDLIGYPEQGYVSEELGELLLVTGRPEDARPRFRRAYELLKQRLGFDAEQSARLTRLNELCQWPDE